MTYKLTQDEKEELEVLRKQWKAEKIPEAKRKEMREAFRVKKAEEAEKRLAAASGAPAEAPATTDSATASAETGPSVETDPAEAPATTDTATASAETGPS